MIKILRSERINNRTYLTAICPLCTNEFKLRKDCLKKTISCGCSWRRPGISRRLQHIHNSMMMRCYNKKSTFFSLYGGNNITVCEEWHLTTNFYKWALSSGYQENLTIDRIDNSKGYFPENCRWATRKEQVRNRTNTVITPEIIILIRSYPKRHSLTKLSLELGINISTIKAVRYNYNWID